MLFTRLAAPFGGRDLAVGNPSVPSFSDLRGRVSVYGFVYKYACVYLCVCECMCVCMYDSFFSFLTHTDQVQSAVWCTGNMGPCGPADLHLHSMAGFAWWYGYYGLIMYIYFMILNPWLNIG